MKTGTTTHEKVGRIDWKRDDCVSPGELMRIFCFMLCTNCKNEECQVKTGNDQRSVTG